MRIVIPSKGRADRVLSTKVVIDPILCVSESENEEYQKYNPNIEIVTHPDSIVGLIPKRNWMYRHFGDIFMVDDDIECVQDRSAGNDEKSSQNISKEDVTSRIYWLYELSKMIGVNIYGFGQKTTPALYKVDKPLCLSSHITGCCYGVNQSPHVHWNEDFKLKEDYLISCTMKYNERMILTDNTMYFVQKDTMVNIGGLSSIRNKKTEMENILMLRRFFGECIKLKSNKTSNGKKFINAKTKYNITTIFNF